MNVELELLTHPKYRRLRKAVGPEAVEYLLRLWGHCGTNKRGERWPGADAFYVECVCDWQGTAGSLYTALLEARFIDVVNGCVVVHDWEDQNSFTVANWARNPNGRGGKKRVPTTVKTPDSSTANPRTTHGQDQHTANDKTPDAPQDLSADNPRTTHGEPLRVSDKSEESEESEGATPPRIPSGPSDAEIPTEAEFLGAFMAEGIPEDFLRSRYAWFEGNNAWLDGKGRLKNWRVLVRSWWAGQRSAWGPQGGGATGGLEKNSARPMSAAQRLYLLDAELEEVQARLDTAHALNAPPDAKDVARERELKKTRAEILSEKGAVA